MKYISFLLIAASMTFMISCKGDKKAVKEETKQEVKKVGNKVMSEGTLNIMPGKAFVLWKGSKPTGEHAGQINAKTGHVNIKGGKVVGGSFVLDMNTLMVSDLEGDQKADLESHLKGLEAGKEDHFFNVQKYPEAKFEITKVTNLVNDDKANSLVYGKLTIRDITKDIAFKGNINIYADAASIDTEYFQLNRTDWGINFMSKSVFDDLKDKFINDKIDIRVRAKFKS